MRAFGFAISHPDQRPGRLRPRSAVGLSVILLLAGCTGTAPAKLPPPPQVSCFTLPTALSFTKGRGLFGTKQTTRLERGPYLAEHTDPEGTYYRAPPGGLSLFFADDGKPTYGIPLANDGGIYIPHDPAAPPKLYRYFSTANAQVIVPPDDADCTNVHYVLDPVTKGVSSVAFALAGAEGGALGGLAGRSLKLGSGPRLSYGQSAAAGAAGGLIGGLIVAAIINSEVGNIVLPGTRLDDDQTIAEIERAAKTAGPLDPSQAEQPLPVTAQK